MMEIEGQGKGRPPKCCGRETISKPDATYLWAVAKVVPRGLLPGAEKAGSNLNELCVHAPSCPNAKPPGQFLQPHVVLRVMATNDFLAFPLQLLHSNYGCCTSL